jgi:uncharacterized protein (PEP-CTERM system associated)
MTIITAKRPARALRLTPFALAALLLSAECHADWKFTPTIGATETYTDNVSLQADAQARSQFVSEVTPGFAVKTTGPRVKFSASARWHLFGYQDSDLPNTANIQHDYSAILQAKLAEDLFLDSSFSGGPQAISAFGPQISDSLYSLGNRTNVNAWRISPYVRHRYGSVVDMTLRYSRDGVDAGAHNPFASSTSSTGSLNLASGTSFRTLGWGLSYSHQEMNNRLAGPSTSSNALADLRLRYSPQLSGTASVGYDEYDYQSLGGRTAGRSWTGGLIWTPSSRTSLNASFGHRYFGKTGSLAASHHSRHSIWSINYSDAVTTTRQQMLLPSTIDTAALLDTLFSATIPDPVLREQAVQAYLQASGLPPSLANNVNYMSNRYLRQKQLQAAVAFNWAHSSLVSSLFRTERSALSLQQSDSELLGSQLSSLNDNIRQRGLDETFSYRLSSRTVATATARLSRVTSLSNGVTENRREYRAGLTRRLDRRLNLAADLRHVAGGRGAGTGQTYQENAVSASLSAQF